MGKHSETKRRPASEWRREVRQWRRSGQSAAEYAERAGIRASTLQWWAWKLRADTTRAGTGDRLRLVAVDVVEDGQDERVGQVAVGSQQQGWELRSAAGHVLRVTGPFTAAHAEAVLSAVLGGRQESA